MIGLPNPSDLAPFINLLAPGILILAIRGAVRAGPSPDLKDRAISYAAVSAAYYALAYPIFHWESGVLLRSELWALLQYLLFPAFIGLLAAYEYQAQWLRRLAAKANLHLLSPIPTAWDFAFDRLQSGTFLLVTLTNDTQVAGLMGANSFASSSKEERDLLLEQVWKIEENGEWVEATPSRRILLCGQDIRHIEIYQPQGA